MLSIQKIGVIMVCKTAEPSFNSGGGQFPAEWVGHFAAEWVDLFSAESVDQFARKLQSVLKNEFFNNYVTSYRNPNFKFYWNKAEKPIYIYPKFDFGVANEELISLYKDEINEIIRFFKTHKSFQKIY